jgi:hypothetical protein
MNNLDLLKQAKKYLDDYLENFVLNGVEDDITHLFFGNIINPALVRNYDFEDIEIINFHKTRFNYINNQFEKKSLDKTIKKIIDMPSPVVIDIASFCGERFGLHIAKHNPNSKVYVYDPINMNCIPKFLFNGLNNIICQLDKNVEFQSNYQATINKLYEANNLRNIKFFNEPITKEKIIEYSNLNDNIIVYASRIFQLLPMFKEAIEKKENIDYVIMPLSNLPKGYFVKGFEDDNIVNLIQKYTRNVREYNVKEIYDTSYNAKTRLTTMTNIYLTLKMALLKDKSKVYALEKDTAGFPFSGPTHYVSSL